MKGETSMKELVQASKISYRWWRPDGKDVNKRHIEELREHADTHIREVMDDGYTCGQLLTTIGMTEYEGWWDAESESET